MDRIWEILQIEATKDTREIKRAYARLSKEIHPEEKPEEFQKLYDAYQKALQYASSDKKPERYTEYFETDRKTGDWPETEAAQAEKERSRYEELGLDPEKNPKYQYKYDLVEEIAYFQSWWEKRVPVWLKRESFLEEEGAEYLRSESFRKIMWSPAVLKIIAEGLGRYFLRSERVLLFFWDLYGFEETGEEGCSEESLLLYRKLYPAYTNRIKRQQYAENKQDIQKKEWKRIYKIIIIVCVCLLIALLSVFFLNEDAVAIIYIVLLLLFFIYCCSRCFNFRWW